MAWSFYSEINITCETNATRRVQISGCTGRNVKIYKKQI